MFGKFCRLCFVEIEVNVFRDSFVLQIFFYAKNLATQSKIAYKNSIGLHGNILAYKKYGQVVQSMYT